MRRYPWDALSIISFDNCRRTQWKESHHRAHLEPGGAAVREPQQVVVETILLVPHPVRSWLVHGGGDVEEVLGELHDHVLVGGVVAGELIGEFHHILTEQGHPGCAIRLLQMAATRARCAGGATPDV